MNLCDDKDDDISIDSDLPDLPGHVWVQIMTSVDDESRLALAKTCSILMSLFKQRVGFDKTVVYSRKDLEYFIPAGCKSSITNTLTTSHFCELALSKHYFNWNHHPVIFGRHLCRTAQKRRFENGAPAMLIHKPHEPKEAVAVVPFLSGSNNGEFPAEFTYDPERFSMFGKLCRYSSWEFIIKDSSIQSESNLTAEWKLYPDDTR